MTRAELLKSAKPILFNTEMVRAILDGRKTTTRRVIKPQPKNRIAYCFAGYKYGTWGYPSEDVYKYWSDIFKRTHPLTEVEENQRWKPPYHTDDILYVRETFSEVETVDGKPYYIYKADDDGTYYKHLYSSRENFRKWRPSIHMPKEIARIFLRVTNVSVERLQDITSEGCICEGIEASLIKEGLAEFAIGLFHDIWDKTIRNNDLPLYGFNANPWVWVIKFEILEV